VPGFIVAGIGIGIVNPVLASASVAVVPFQRSGMASGANSTFRQIGIATGIAALGAVFASEIQHKTVGLLNATSIGREVVTAGGSRLSEALQAGGVRAAVAAIPSAPARSALLHAYRVGFSGTLNELMVIGAVVSFVGAVLALALVRQQDFVPSYAGEDAHRAPAAGETEPAAAVVA
jgi:hypothetical protein